MLMEGGNVRTKLGREQLLDFIEFHHQCQCVEVPVR